MSAKFNQFLAWSVQQQYYRLPYLAGMILVQGCIIAPLTLWSIAVNPYESIQIPIITIATFLVLVTNLADMPTKVTIPLFAVSALSAVLIISYNLVW